MYASSSDMTLSTHRVIISPPHQSTLQCQVVTLHWAFLPPLHSVFANYRPAALHI